MHKKAIHNEQTVVRLFAFESVPLLVLHPIYARNVEEDGSGEGRAFQQKNSKGVEGTWVDL